MSVVKRIGRILPAVCAAFLGAGMAVAGSGCTGRLALSGPRTEIRPEVASAALEVREFGPRKAELFLEVTLEDAGASFCPRAMHLEWMVNEGNFATSSHALSGECVRQGQSSIPVEVSLTYLALPMGRRRDSDTTLAVQGVLVVEREDTGEESRVYFSASSPLKGLAGGGREAPSMRLRPQGSFGR